jgi:flagellar operon protein
MKWGELSMIERISSQLSTAASQGLDTATTSPRENEFGKLFQKELDRQTQPVAFSKHAQARVEERGIEITPDLMDQLRGGLVRAQAKGATNILAMDAEKAFIINVPNARVITALTQEEMKENIFTNIDGAVFL